MRKKKVLFQSNFSKSKTGFGRNARAILSYLHETGKYEIVEYCNAPFRWSDANCKNMPWKCYGSMPDNESDYHSVSNDPAIARSASYGGLFIDKVIKKEKPDIYLGVEDIWAFNDYWSKPWWNKTTCAIWTTIDSLPIIDIAHKNAHKIKNYWVWADFAREAMHKLGHTHVETVNGTINTDDFYPLDSDKVKEFRQKNGISDDTLIFGFVFRNQLRKLAWKILEAFAKFKKRNPDTKAKILLHTYWDEGWKLKDFMKEFGLTGEDVICTYVCGHCRNVEIKPYVGQGAKCNACENRSLVNPRTIFGCTEEDLNMIYNSMDAYIHPMTSGGLEIPIIESMLTGLPTATVPYSCGTEYTDNSFVYSLDYNEYREMASTFIKAQVEEDSILDFMESIKAIKGSDSYEYISKKSREWALDKFSIHKVGKKIEDWLDAQPLTDYDFDFVEGKFNEDYEFHSKEEIPDDLDWAIDLYKGFFGMTEDSHSDGVRDIIAALDGKKSREEIHTAFIEKAKLENSREAKIDLLDMIEDSDKKKLAYVMPKSYGDCLISLGVLDQIRKTYPDWDIYVATMEGYEEVFEHVDYIKAILPYTPRMDDYQWWEGNGHNDGIVDIVFLPHILTQRISSYTHNGLDRNVLQETPISGMKTR